MTPQQGLWNLERSVVHCHPHVISILTTPKNTTHFVYSPWILTCTLQMGTISTWLLMSTPPSVKTPKGVSRNKSKPNRRRSGLSWENHWEKLRNPHAQVCWLLMDQSLKEVHGKPGSKSSATGRFNHSYPPAHPPPRWGPLPPTRHLGRCTEAVGGNGPRPPGGSNPYHSGDPSLSVPAGCDLRVPHPAGQDGKGTFTPKVCVKVSWTCVSVCFYRTLSDKHY